MLAVGLWFGLILQAFSVNGLTLSQIFPFDGTTDESLPTDLEEISSREITLNTSIVFYEQNYSSIYVNENGLVSFASELPTFFNVQFPLDYPLIAPFYADVDTRQAGLITHHESTESVTLEKATQHIQRHFSQGQDFVASSVFVVTWDRVGYFAKKDDKLNTFQLAIASDGQDSYALFLYPDRGIQWIQSEGKNPDSPDALAQAGFVAGNGRYLTLKGSGTDQIFNLDKWSNVGVPGLWMYRIGEVETDTQMHPDLNLAREVLEPFGAENCALGALTCHSKAQCIDYNPGYCCVCNASGFFGNGRICLPESTPQRFTGKISGTVNGVTFEDQALHSYVIASDGRAYTAISKIPETLGYDMQSMSIIGSGISWLFAKPNLGTLNGFQLTGGKLNYTAEINFPQSGERVTVEQRFRGADVYGYLKADIRIYGTIPNVPSLAQVEIPDYEEEYTLISPGLLRGRTQRSFRWSDSAIDHPFTVDHTVTFDDCAWTPVDTRPKSFRLKVTRGFMLYEAKEQIVRYGMTTKVLLPGSDVDPCEKGKNICGSHSSCLVEGDDFRCVCNKGYSLSYEEGTTDAKKAKCVDVNECLHGLDQCDVNAQCLNEPGTYRCLCKEGFHGNGFICEQEDPCISVHCGNHAECLVKEGKIPECRCLSGYSGDGLNCISQSLAPDCRQVNYCDINADCAYKADVNGFRCQCRSEYSGDGIVCIPTTESCELADNCSPYAQCIYDHNVKSYACKCLPTFEGDGYTCSDLQTTPPNPICVLGECWCPSPFTYANNQCHEKDETLHDTGSCNVINNCHPHAQCIYEPAVSQYACRCNAGYSGSGLECTSAGFKYPDPVESELSCDKDVMCHPHANCLYDDDTLKSVCVCNSGYRGDGILCTPSDGCNSLLDCDVNAQCVYSSEEERYICQCNQNYLADGNTCSLNRPTSDLISSTSEKTVNEPDTLGNGLNDLQPILSCNFVNNCDANAECAYDIDAIGYRCRCKEGFAGNGHFCRPSRSCNEDANVCHQNASCIWSVNGYHCHCNDKFIGDGFNCEVLKKHEGNFLLVNHGMVVLRVPLKPSSLNPGRIIQIESSQTALGNDIDCLQGKVYWSDATGHAIKYANYDGTGLGTFLSDIGSPEGVAVDWASRNIYWVDASKNTIEVANLDSKIRRTLVNTSLSNPRGIAVHINRGLLFWSDWNRNEPKIEKANADGSQRSIFVGEGLGLPNSLTVDTERDEVCWADAGIHRIECATIDGSGRRTLKSHVKHPFGITGLGENLYWTDWEEKRIQIAAKSNGAANGSLELPLGGHGKLYDLVAVPDTCPRVSSPCQIQNGGCPVGLLCLPNGFGSRSCI